MPLLPFLEGFLDSPSMEDVFDMPAGLCSDEEAQASAECTLSAPQACDRV